MSQTNLFTYYYFLSIIEMIAIGEKGSVLKLFLRHVIFFHYALSHIGSSHFILKTLFSLVQDHF